MWWKESNEVRFPQYIAALVATGGAFSMGTILGWPSPTYPRMVNINQIEIDNNHIITATDSQFAWFSSAMTLSASISCLFSGLLCNWLGRRTTLLLSVFPQLLGWVMIILATDIDMIYAGNAFLGISVGINCMAVPVYNSEIAQKEIRGKLGSYFQLMVNFGVFFVYATGYGLSVQYYSLICLLVPGCITFFLLFMPETPTYLVNKGKYKKAGKALQWLRGGGFNYKQEIEDMKSEKEILNLTSKDTVKAICRKTTIHGLFLITGIMITYQMTGINAIIFYTTKIFQEANTNLDIVIATIIVGASQVLATFLTSVCVDKFGRRIILIFSVFFMTCATIIIGSYFQVKHSDADSVSGIGWLPILGLSIFVIMFSLGIGSVAWIIVGEIFAPDTRGMAAAYASSLNLILAFVIAISYKPMNDTIGVHGTFWLFTGFGIFGLIFIFLFVPETKGLKIEEIQDILSQNKIFMFK